MAYLNYDEQRLAQQITLTVIIVKSLEFYLIFI